MNTYLFFWYFVIDLRGHGQSSSLIKTNTINSQHTIFECALDIIETAKTLNLTGDLSPVAVIGHSFGGRCALQYLHTLKFNKQLHVHSISSSPSILMPPKCTWILDSVPGKAHSSVSNVIQALTNINLATISSKQDLVKVLTSQHKIDKGIADWMTTNLQKRKDDIFEFMFDLNIVQGVLNDFPKQDFMQMMKDSTFNVDVNEGKVYLVMAGKNSAWTSDIVNDLRYLEENQDLQLISLPKAGHWVHVDDLDGLMSAMDQCFHDITITS